LGAAAHDEIPVSLFSILSHRTLLGRPVVPGGNEDDRVPPPGGPSIVAIVAILAIPAIPGDGAGR